MLVLIKCFIKTWDSFQENVSSTYYKKGELTRKWLRVRVSRLLLKPQSVALLLNVMLLDSRSI